MMTQTLIRLTIIVALTLLLVNAVHAEEKSVSSDETTATEDTAASSSEETAVSSSEETESITASDTATADTTTQEAPKPKQDVTRRIARAQFTTAIADREPTDNIVMLTNNNEIIYFFTELINFNGQNIKHRWEYEGKEMAVVTFKVDGSRWRIHSRKNIKPEWKGVWSVIVYDEDDRPLKVTSFEVVDANSNH